jgi:hypothetical protein
MDGTQRRFASTSESRRRLVLRAIKSIIGTAYDFAKYGAVSNWIGPSSKEAIRAEHKIRRTAHMFPDRQRSLIGRSGRGSALEPRIAE